MEETLVAPQTISMEKEKEIVTVMTTVSRVYIADITIAVELPLKMAMIAAISVRKSRIVKTTTQNLVCQV